MTFAEALFSGNFPVALEITPPQRSMPALLLRRARLLSERAVAINVIQRPGRQSSLEASKELLAAGVEPVWHLVTRGRSREEIAGDLEIAAASGIRNVLCIRGDHDASDRAGAPTIREVVAMVCAAVGGGVTGATLNQYAPDAEAAWRNLRPKLAAGARYVQSQPVFDPDALAPLARRLASESPDTRLVAMAMPLLSLEALEKVEARLGIRLPAWVRARVSGKGPEGAWEFFDETVAALGRGGLAHGLAIMTFEMDPVGSTGGRIVESLRRAGVGAGRHGQPA